MSRIFDVSLKDLKINHKLYVGFGLIIAIAIMICSLFTYRSVTISVLLGVGSIILFRKALTREPLRQLMVAGGIILLFMIPIPLKLAENMTYILQKMHVFLVPSIFELFTTIYELFRTL